MSTALSHCYKLHLSSKKCWPGDIFPHLLAWEWAEQIAALLLRPTWPAVQTSVTQIGPYDKQSDPTDEESGGQVFSVCALCCVRKYFHWTHRDTKRHVCSKWTWLFCIPLEALGADTTLAFFSLEQPNTTTAPCFSKRIRRKGLVLRWILWPDWISAATGKVLTKVTYCLFVASAKNADSHSN